MSPRAQGIVRASTGSNLSDSPYVLGYTDAEQERLIRQSARLAPYTEHFFRQVGICTGQRVLDLGSGVGDVAMLVADIVGPSGEVVGIERDSRSIKRAQTRAANRGLHNVHFLHCDADQIPDDKPFDAAVGRLILMFLPDPVSVLRLVSRHVRHGGVVAFQEPSWAASLLMSLNLPLWWKGASLCCETFRRCGANPEIGLMLYRMFQDAGLPAPTMRMEIPLGNDAEFLRWMHDLLCSLRPQMLQHNLPAASLGDLESFPSRLQAEVTAANAVVPWMALVGASSLRLS